MMEYRWSEGRYDQLAEMAQDLVRRQVTLIVVTGVPAALAVKAATSAIPIVFVIGPDPVELQTGRQSEQAGRQSDRGDVFH